MKTLKRFLDLGLSLYEATSDFETVIHLLIQIDDIDFFKEMIELLFKKYKYDLSRPVYFGGNKKASSVIELLCEEYLNGKPKEKKPKNKKNQKDSEEEKEEKKPKKKKNQLDSEEEKEM